MVFVPLESPDCIELPSAEDADFRKVVDEMLGAKHALIDELVDIPWFYRPMRVVLSS